MEIKSNFFAGERQVMAELVFLAGTDAQRSFVQSVMESDKVLPLLKCATRPWGAGAVLRKMEALQVLAPRP